MSKYFLLILNVSSQILKSTLILYADNSRPLYQHKEVDEVKKQLYKDFESISEWLVGNKLSIHFGGDKTKSILFTSKRRSKNVRLLNIRYKHINIKQHLQVTYLGCVLD